MDRAQHHNNVLVIVLVNSFFPVLKMGRPQCVCKTLNILHWFSWFHSKFRFWGPNVAGHLLSNWSNVDRCSFSKVPLKAVHLWIPMAHLDQCLDWRNSKASCTPWDVISSSSSITKIQECFKCSDGISFIYGFLEVSRRIMVTMCSSSSFITTLGGVNLWSKGRFNWMLAVRLRGFIKNAHIKLLHLL